jgi:hypothetical protein
MLLQNLILRSAKRVSKDGQELQCMPLSFETLTSGRLLRV